MELHVPVSSIACMIAAGVVAFAIPVVLLILLRVKKKADYPPFVAGLVVFVLFALVLERLVHTLVLSSAAGERIQSTPWLYALYGGAMAGLFEETGRLLAFRTVLRRYQSRDVNALMYGAGHGGIEAAILLGVTSVNNVIYSVLLNLGKSDLLTGQVTGSALEQLQGVFRELATTPGWVFLMGMAERISAVALHLGLSVLVWFAVKGKKPGLFILAILLHLAVDAVTVLLSGAGVPIPALEGILLVLAAAVDGLAWLVWRRERDVEAAGEEE